MVLPSTLIKYIDDISQPFGGYESVLSLVNQAALETLVTFPGFVYVVKPWAPLIDLSIHGYKNGSFYRVLDQDFQLIYSGRSNSGHFGESDREIELLFEQPHGSFIYLQFETLEEPKLGLLWVCNQLSREQIKNQILVWEDLVNQQLIQQNQHEIFLRTDQLQPTDKIRIFFLSGLLHQRFTPEQIINAPEMQYSDHFGDEIITLYPRSGWYLFQAIRKGESQNLELTEFIGVGLTKLKATPTGTYFIDLLNNSGVLQPTIRSYPSINTMIGTAERFIRLEAVLQLAPPELLEGSSCMEIEPTVYRNPLLDPLEGHTEGLVYAEASMQSIVEGRGQTESRIVQSEILNNEGHSETTASPYFYINVAHDANAHSHSSIGYPNVTEMEIEDGGSAWSESDSDPMILIDNNDS